MEARDKLSEFPCPILRQQLAYCPDVIGNFGFHRRRDAQRFLNPAEVVIGEVQGEVATLWACRLNTRKARYAPRTS